MQSELHLHTTVLPDRRIELEVPEYEPGIPVDVIVSSSKIKRPAAGNKVHRTALEIFESAKVHRMFQSSAEVDRHLREERNSWDR